MNTSKVENIIRINLLRKQKNAIILAHYYQLPEIQDIADFIGDSLSLAQVAQKTDADIIVFAGVHFMAETAKIINPSKKVLIPDLEAGCSLADSCKAEDLKKFVANYPDHKIVSYINCSAEVKAISEIICTSSNAVKVVNRFPENQKLIFVPDKNLGAYVNTITGKNMVLWNGTCQIHDILTLEKVLELKSQNPDAKLISHPECKAVILEISDFIGSTNALLDFTQKDSAVKYIVATETGIIHQMKKTSPHKTFIIVPSDETCACNDCVYMKKNTLEKLYLCLSNENPEIIMEEDLIKKAKEPLQKMLDFSN
jgi:quinolinate synthase